MPEEFRDRERAESFGSIAEQYDRYRPAAPAALLDEFAAPAPSRVLDVGCGTGKLARGLVERGLTVLGIEVDERMAAIARGHGVEVEVAAFEDWDDGGRTFDLITCGDAWHWIDPARGWRKIGVVLRPGGTVARCWSDYRVDGPLRSALEAVYARVLPDVDHGGPKHGRDEADPRVENRTYPWERTYSADGVGGTDLDLQRPSDAPARPAGGAPGRGARGDHRRRRDRPRQRLDARQSFACSAALSPAQLPERGSASTVPVRELRRKSRPLAPLRSRPLTTSPSGSVTSVPPVT